MKVFIVIAAFNEAKNIGGVIKSLKKYKNIVVVDDCSTDNTYDVVKRNKIVVLRHSINRGQGAALQTGMDYALQKGADVIVHFDADGQHLATEIPKLIRPLREGVDVVFGSRFLRRTSDVPFFKKIILKAGIWFNFILYGVKMSDAHNGFRALTKKAVKKIRISEDRMEHASEIVELVHNANLKYKEVPVTILYNGVSQSPLNAFKMGVRLVFKKLLN